MPFSLTRMFGHPCVERTGSLRLRLVGLNLNHALWVNSDRTDRTYWYPAFDHALDGPGHVRLPECGRGASHGYCPEFCLSVIAASAPRTDSAPDTTFSIRSARPSRIGCEKGFKPRRKGQL